MCLYLSFPPDNNGSVTVRLVCHVWHDDHHRPDTYAGEQLCHHLQEQVVEKQDKHKEEAVAAAGQDHQEDQHPPQSCLLQWDVWGITVNIIHICTFQPMHYRLRLGMAMRMRKMRIHVGYALIYKANKRIICGCDADDAHRQKLPHGHP